MQSKTMTRGFTLIEIMAVVLIIGLLSTLVGLAVFR
jgi:prepilin-type N-terminal cleavage/methylation domain-containing protein